MSDLENIDFDSIVQELDEDGRSFVENGAAGMPEILNPVYPHRYQDPLQAELERLHRAAQKSGVNDEFYHMLEAHLDRVRKANSDAREVGNPPSATNQNLGGNVALTSDVVIVSKALASWTGTDAESGPVTVTLGVITPLAVITVAVRPFAYVRWGSYGVNFNAEIDIGTGRQFTVNASMIEVEGALDALSASNTAQANLAASLSFRPMVRTSSLIRTKYADSLAQNGTSTITVPPFAVGVLPVQMSDTAGQVQLDFYDTSNTIRYSILITNGSQVTPIPLTSDIVKVVLTNKTALTQQVRVPFELSF